MEQVAEVPVVQTLRDTEGELIQGEPLGEQMKRLY